MDKIKLHYVVHYINRGLWDHIVPEEGDREGKIDQYQCNACDRRFKNFLEKQEYPGTWPMSSLHNVNKQLSFFKNVNKQLSLFKNVIEMHAYNGYEGKYVIFLVAYDVRWKIFVGILPSNPNSS